MKTAAYADFILTVIAVCLVYLCLGRPFLSEAVEARQHTSVVITGFDTGQGDITRVLPVRIVGQK